MQQKWTEAKVTSLMASGYGSGSGAEYKPWIEVRDVSSDGRRHFVPKTRFGRDVHLLSDIEYRLFLLLEWSDDVQDVNEQFPLDRDITQDVARQLGIRHPYYPGTHVPTVMTVDFMVELVRNGQLVYEAFDAKDDSAAEDERTLEKLEIQRSALELMEIPHHLVFGSSLPEEKVKKLDWLQRARLRPNEAEPSPGYFDEMTRRFNLHASRANPSKTLRQVCSEFDLMHDAIPGTGIRAAGILMHRKEIGFDLTAPRLEEASLSSFTFKDQTELRLASGGW